MYSTFKKRTKTNEVLQVFPQDEAPKKRRITEHKTQSKNPRKFS